MTRVLIRKNEKNLLCPKKKLRKRQYLISKGKRRRLVVKQWSDRYSLKIRVDQKTGAFALLAENYEFCNISDFFTIQGTTSICEDYDAKNIKICDNYENRSLRKVGLIYNAIKRRENEVVIENLLKSEGDINYRILKKSGMIPNLLHEASTAFYYSKIFDLFLNYGADFNCKDDKGRTVIHAKIQEAIDNQDLMLEKSYKYFHIDSILNAQVKLNDPINPYDANNGISHFHAACMTNNVKAVRFFLENGIDVNQTVKADSSIFPLYTPLHLAVKYTCPDVVELLLAFGAYPYVKNADGLSPLHLIIQKAVDNTEKAEFKRMKNIFIKHVFDNTDTNNFGTTDDFGFSNFHAVCLLQDKNIVETVLKKIKDINQAININSPICPGYTALHFAAFSNIEVFKLLLNNGANYRAENAKKETPLDLCLRNYTIDNIHSIISSISEFANIILSDNETKFLDVITAMKNTNDFILFLNNVESVATTFIPFDSPLWAGYTILHLAVIFTLNKKELVAECLRYGANVEIVNANGLTAVHLAFYLKKMFVADYLLYQYANTENPIDPDGLSYLHVACALGNRKAVQHFVTIGVDVNRPILSSVEYTNYGEELFVIPTGSTALHISMITRNYRIAIQLLKNRVDIFAPDVNGLTPVHQLLSGVKNNTYSKVDFSNRNVDNLIELTAHWGLDFHLACYLNLYDTIEKLLRIKIHTNGKNSGSKFLLKYLKYTPLDLFWHPRYIEKIGNYLEKFWIISFRLMKRNNDILAESEKGMLLRKNCLQMINDDHCNFAYKSLIQDTVLQEKFEEKFGITTLHLACCVADFRLVKKLIKNVENVNERVHCNSPVWQGFTALHFAVNRVFENYNEAFFVIKIKKIVRLLINHGADPLIVNDKNETIFHVVNRLYENDPFRLKIVLTFVSSLFNYLNNFNFNIRNDQGISIFHIACMTANTQAIKQFLMHGIDVNEPISYFSDFNPGCTALHLILKYNQQLKDQSDIFSNDDLLLIINILISNGANINAVDVLKETPLFDVVQTERNRVSLVMILMSYGAKIHIKSVRGYTPFELLLMQEIVRLEEIELFLSFGCKLNGYNSIREEGYLAKFCNLKYKFDSLGKRKSLVNSVINHPSITEIDNSGRTALHNVVSVYVNKEETWSDESVIYFFEKEASIEFKREFIKKLIIQGCHIDQQDNLGRTALHSAVAFKNYRAILELLKNGADINIVDRNGNTAFDYCQSREYYPSYVREVFVEHVIKLEFTKQIVSKRNIQLKDEALKNDRFTDNTFAFYNELDKAKSIKIGKTFPSLYEFLMNPYISRIYMRMLKEERQEVEEFFENFDKLKFSEINCLLYLKYNQSILRLRLFDPALKLFNIIIDYRIPDLCCRMILNLLKNPDLKSIIASVE